MTDADFDKLIRIAVDSADMDDPAAPEARRRECLRMSGLEALASGQRVANTAESAHLRACALCAGRMRAFAGIDALAATTSVGAFDGGRRGALSIGGNQRMAFAGFAAAAALLLMVFLPETVRNSTISGRTAARLGSSGASMAQRSVWSTCMMGDADCDGKLTSHDMTAFMLAVSDPDSYQAHYPTCDLVCVNDTNCDGHVDDSDIEPFMEYVAAGT